MRTGNATIGFVGIIRYLVWKGKVPVEVYNEVKTAYGDNAMNCTRVLKWCREFKSGHTCVHDDQRSGRPSIVTDKIVEKSKMHSRRYQVDCGLTFCDISANLQIYATRYHHRNPWISETVHEVGPKTADRPTQV